MKISRIALASLISFGVLGGASLNASASHHSHYNKVLWNKPMAHKKVTLKNGKGIIWNKPFKTAKNAKIMYRISHKKGLVLTTIRHMKVKNGTIYYFVKAGKVTGWINKKSIKLVKATSTKTVTEPTRTTPAPQVPKTTTPSTQQGSTANANKSSQSSTNGSTAQGTAVQGSAGTVTNSSSSTDNGTVTTNNGFKLPVDHNNPFSTYAEGTLKDHTYVYHQKYFGKKIVNQRLSDGLPKGTKVTVALNTPHSNRKTLLIKAETPKGTVYGYVQRSEVQFQNPTDTDASKKSTNSPVTNTATNTTPKATNQSPVAPTSAPATVSPQAGVTDPSTPFTGANPYNWGGATGSKETVSTSGNPYRWDGSQAAKSVVTPTGNPTPSTPVIPSTPASSTAPAVGKSSQWDSNASTATPVSPSTSNPYHWG
ncbi:GW dipeptide domain-containing protein [Lentilactobacillus sunkii]|uniref:GW domain-containing protein n=1 Tax=Lentilactobacillus sunkii DSM 19904 TaxID=1423808 RepID=A0A0R1LCN4_9LACO|nr:GW dipeptide domain-containing protein [Lentilactobacillus sunkii]KRK89495.1 hypothetical protein FD17_GL001080 [Lentilactobacillus sunkii DSM 19904]